MKKAIDVWFLDHNGNKMVASYQMAESDMNEWINIAMKYGIKVADNHFIPFHRILEMKIEQ